jgi:hypothetical protein
MTVFERRPQPERVTAPAARQRGSVLADWLSTTDHKIIGHLYLITSFVFFMIGGLLAMIMRTQLLGPDNHIVSDQQYNELFTMHGAIMLLFATPLFIGLGNEIMPLQIGAGRGVPADEPAVLLLLPARRPDRAGQLHHPGRRAGVRLVRLIAADQRAVLAGHRRRHVDHGPGALGARHDPGRREQPSCACAPPA